MNKGHAILSRSLPAIVLCIILFAGKAEAQVQVSEQQWVLPTYKVAPPDKNPMFFKGESYQGASKYIYPYGMNDVISNEKEDHAWKALILENEYIRLCVTPEIGGKLYYGTDKTNGYNFLYKNNVFKPSNIGMLGAWVSGGTEWCIIHHHRASTLLPMDYALAENEDGSKTIWIGETEPRHRMRWTVGITAYPGKSYYSAEVKIHNPTPYTNTFLYWANVATSTNVNYQAIFPPSVQVATYHAKNSFTYWPVSTEIYDGQDFTKGVDISWWKNAARNNSFFAYDLKEDFMGGYDHGKETGTVHIADHNIVKGAKLWEWGSGPRGQATEAVLTEKDGPYVEIMVGAFSDNQPDYSWIRPYEVKTFRQYWYPVKDIEGFKYANLNGAVNLEERKDNTVFLGYYSTQKVSKAKVVLKRKGETIFEKVAEISPATAFVQSVRIPGTIVMTDLSTEMINSETGEVLVSYQPVKQKDRGPLPETVKKPPLPGEISTIEELYLTGSRIQQFYNTALDPMDYFNEALKRDPNDIRTNVAVGNRHLVNGDYELARKNFLAAIKRLTKDYTRPSDCEALFLEGITLKALGLYDEAADTLYRATWDNAYHSAAYLELARISSIKNNYSRALEEVNKSLSTGANNNSAINLKASLLRKTGDAEGANAALAGLKRTDPLDFRTGNEIYLIAKKGGSASEAENALDDLNKKMRDFDQNYLELAIGYLNDGFPEEAEEILMRFSGHNQFVNYYLGYLNDKKGNKTEAEKYFRAGSALPVDYGFPFRMEDVRVLNLASQYMPADAKPYYYMGNLLYDHQPEKAIENWEKAVKLDQSLAIAWRNMGWGYFYHNHDIAKSINAYEQALQYKNDDPVYYAELDPLYEMNNAPVERRMKLFEGKNEIVKLRDDSFVREIMVLNLAGEAEKAVAYLDKGSFHFREGSSRVREITVDAHLLLGKKFLEEKKYEQALQQFLSIAATPENSQSGSTGDSRSPQINYYTGLAYEALGNKSKAKTCFSLSAAQITAENEFTRYYQGLSLKKLGNKTRAEEYFRALTAEGDKLMNATAETDYFAKFGEQESEQVRKSNAYLLKGLGYKGLGDKESASMNLRKAVELSASNLYAHVEMD